MTNYFLDKLVVEPLKAMFEWIFSAVVALLGSLWTLIHPILQSKVVWSIALGLASLKVIQIVFRRLRDRKRDTSRSQAEAGLALPRTTFAPDVSPSGTLSPDQADGNPAGPRRVVNATRNQYLAAVFSIVPGAGHLYIGQRRKALPVLLGSPITIFVAWHDAKVMCRRLNERGTIGDWESFWDRNRWRLIETRDVKIVEDECGEETRKFDNSEGTTPIEREFKIEKKAISTVTVSEEQMQVHSATTERASLKGRLLSLPLRGSSFGKRETVETSLRRAITKSLTEETTCCESHKISIPPKTIATLSIKWKRKVTHGTLVLEDQWENRITAPFKVVGDLTADLRKKDVPAIKRKT